MENQYQETATSSKQANTQMHRFVENPTRLPKDVTERILKDIHIDENARTWAMMARSCIWLNAVRATLAGNVSIKWKHIEESAYAWKASPYTNGSSGNWMHRFLCEIFNWAGVAFEYRVVKWTGNGIRVRTLIKPCPHIRYKKQCYKMGLDFPTKETKVGCDFARAFCRIWEALSEWRRMQVRVAMTAVRNDCTAITSDMRWDLPDEIEW